MKTAITTPALLAAAAAFAAVSAFAAASVAAVAAVAADSGQRGVFGGGELRGRSAREGGPRCRLQGCSTRRPGFGFRGRRLGRERLRLVGLRGRARRGCLGLRELGLLGCGQRGVGCRCRSGSSGRDARRARVARGAELDRGAEHRVASRVLVQPGQLGAAAAAGNEVPPPELLDLRLAHPERDAADRLAGDDDPVHREVRAAAGRGGAHGGRRRGGDDRSEC